MRRFQPHNEEKAKPKEEVIPKPTDKAKRIAKSIYMDCAHFSTAQNIVSNSITKIVRKLRCSHGYARKALEESVDITKKPKVSMVFTDEQLEDVYKVYLDYRSRIGNYFTRTKRYAEEKYGISSNQAELMVREAKDRFGG